LLVCVIASNTLLLLSLLLGTIGEPELTLNCNIIEVGLLIIAYLLKKHHVKHVKKIYTAFFELRLLMFMMSFQLSYNNSKRLFISFLIDRNRDFGE